MNELQLHIAIWKNQSYIDTKEYMQHKKEYIQEPIYIKLK